MPLHNVECSNLQQSIRLNDLRMFWFLFCPQGCCAEVHSHHRQWRQAGLWFEGAEVKYLLLSRRLYTVTAAGEAIQSICHRSTSYSNLAAVLFLSFFLKLICIFLWVPQTDIMLLKEQHCSSLKQTFRKWLGCTSSLPFCRRIKGEFLPQFIFIRLELKFDVSDVSLTS